MEIPYARGGCVPRTAAANPGRPLHPDDSTRRSHASRALLEPPACLRGASTPARTKPPMAPSWRPFRTSVSRPRGGLTNGVAVPWR